MKIEVNGVQLAYEKTGSGKPLVLLHGNGEDHHIFKELVAKLQGHFTCYAVDSRNHGESSKTDDYSYDTMAEDIYCFMTALELGAAHIVGFSDGAIIALLLAMSRPEGVGKIALLGVNLKPQDFTEENYRFLEETYAQTKDPLFELMLKQPQIELEEVRAVTAPALVVGAENDLFKPELFEKLAATLPHGQLLLMKGHEHDSYIVHQDILYPDLLAFFAD